MSTNGWECLHGILVELFGSEQGIVLGPELISGLMTIAVPPTSLTRVLKGIARVSNTSSRYFMDDSPNTFDTRAEVIQIAFSPLQSLLTKTLRRTQHMTKCQSTVRHAGGWSSLTPLMTCVMDQGSRLATKMTVLTGVMIRVCTPPSIYCIAMLIEHR